MEQDSKNDVDLSTNRLQVGRSRKLGSSRASGDDAARVTQVGAQPSAKRGVGLSYLHTSPLASEDSSNPVLRDADGRRVSSLRGAAAIRAAALDGRGVGPVGRKKITRPQARVAVGGNLLQLHGGRVKADTGAIPGGIRGLISGFSRGSRRRLIHLLQSIDQTKLLVPLPLFLTLTYGATWPSDARAWKRHLDTFAKRLARKFPGVVAVWRLEFQARGAPHYHLIVFNVRFVSYRWLARAWNDIVYPLNDDVGDMFSDMEYEAYWLEKDAHLKAGTEVRSVKSWRGVMSYAAKYVSKPQEALAGDVTIPENVGRWWGVLGRGNLPITWRQEYMSFAQFYHVRRIVRRYLHSHGVSSRVGLFSGLSAFLPAAAGLRLLEYSGVIQ